MQTNYDFDFLVFVGRFQPFHQGHLKVLQQSLAQSERVIVLCGSARQPRNTRNPWSIAEVQMMIHASVGEQDSMRVDVEPLMDSLYNERYWARSVQDTVQGIVSGGLKPDKEIRVGLVGLSLRGANYYPSRFPQWVSVGVDEDNGIRGIQIRNGLFGMDGCDGPRGTEYLETSQAKMALPEPVRQQLVAYCGSVAYQVMLEEAHFISKYQQAWRDAPYPPTFVTVDAVVIQSGHILMVERRAQPGKGLYALPGGFLRGDELLEEGCIRELREETRLKVPVPVLKGSIRDRRVFDAPYRSQRGRTITHTFLLELEPSPVLPKVRGGDDAKRAFWVPLVELNSENIFEDHYFIIQAMIG